MFLLRSYDTKGLNMNGPGHPSLYKPEYCELGHNYCLLGATNEELGGFFGVTRRTSSHSR